MFIFCHENKLYGICIFSKITPDFIHQLYKFKYQKWKKTMNKFQFSIYMLSKKKTKLLQFFARWKSMPDGNFASSMHLHLNHYCCKSVIQWWSFSAKKIELTINFEFSCDLLASGKKSAWNFVRLNKWKKRVRKKSFQLFAEITASVLPPPLDQQV